MRVVSLVSDWTDSLRLSSILIESGPASSSSIGVLTARFFRLTGESSEKRERKDVDIKECVI